MKEFIERKGNVILGIIIGVCALVISVLALYVEIDKTYQDRNIKMNDQLTAIQANLSQILDASKFPTVQTDYSNMFDSLQKQIDNVNAKVNLLLQRIK